MYFWHLKYQPIPLTSRVAFLSAGWNSKTYFSNLWTDYKSKLRQRTTKYTSVGWCGAMGAGGGAANVAARHTFLHVCAQSAALIPTRGLGSQGGSVTALMHSQRSAASLWSLWLTMVCQNPFVLFMLDFIYRWRTVLVSSLSFLLHSSVHVASTTHFWLDTARCAFENEHMLICCLFRV